MQTKYETRLKDLERKLDSGSSVDELVAIEQEFKNLLEQYTGDQRHSKEFRNKVSSLAEREEKAKKQLEHEREFIANIKKYTNEIVNTRTALGDLDNILWRLQNF